MKFNHTLLAVIVAASSNFGSLAESIGRERLSMNAVPKGITAADWSSIRQQAYLKASNAGAIDVFGWAVAVEGDTLAVSAYAEDSGATGVNGDQNNNNADFSGAVYIFVREGTNWAQQAYLKASNTGVGDHFGWSVAIAGDTVVVGAGGEASNATGVNGNQADNSAPDAGAVYVFVRNGANWTQQAYLKASNTESGDRFGDSVSISGETLLVGAYRDDSSATGVNGDAGNGEAPTSGAAYVFLRTGTNWTQQAYLKASNTGADDNFGWSLALSGDTAVIAARFEDSDAIGVNGDQSNDNAPNSGAAYVFVRDGTNWTQQAYLKASNTQANDNFGGVPGSGAGTSVAVAGDTITIGAMAEDSSSTGVNGNQNDESADFAGAVYVFVRIGTNWNHQAYLKASNTQAGDRFGKTVALYRDTLVVGATQEDSDAIGVEGNQSSNSAVDSGAAYVFTRIGTNWIQRAYLKASNTGADDRFGFQVGMWGNTIVVVGLYEKSSATGVNGNQTNNSLERAGAAYIFNCPDIGPRLVGSWPVSAPGYARAVAVSGRYAYVAAYQGGLHVFDISTPANPLSLGGYDISGSAVAVSVAGNYAFVAGLSSDRLTEEPRGWLAVIDISVPSDPRQIGRYEVNTHAADVAVSGNYVYLVLTGWDQQTEQPQNRIDVIDISTPANPRLVGQYHSTGNASAVAVSGDHAYLVRFWGNPYSGDGRIGLDVIYIRDPASPRRVGEYGSSGWAFDVAVSGNYAYLAAEIAGLQIIDVSNPANPQQVGGFDTAHSAAGVAISGSYVYLADGDGGLQLFNASNPANPQWVGEYDTTGFFFDVALSGNYAYFAAADAGLQVVDVSIPAYPQLVGGYDLMADGRDVAVAGNYAYLADADSGLQVIDVSNPANPQRLGKYHTTGTYVSDVAVSGRYAYVADVEGGLQVIDVSNPGLPMRVGGYDSSAHAVGVAVSGNYAYVAAGGGGACLEIFDISDPANPRPVGRYYRSTASDPIGHAYRVAVSGNYAYVAYGEGGLQVIDVSNPASPQRLGGFAIGADARDVTVSGDYAYVAAETGGLQVIDIRNPVNPRRVGRYNTSGRALHVTVSGKSAYLSVEGAGLLVFDVSNPENPLRTGEYNNSGASGVAVSANYAYLAAGAGGLQVIELFRLPALRLDPSVRIDQSTFRFQLRGELGHLLHIQRSADLITWTDWQSIVPGGASSVHADTNAAAAPAHFYRAILP